MNRSSFVRIKTVSIFLTALVAVSLAACGENLQSGTSCPLLCPPESAPQDTAHPPQCAAVFSWTQTFPQSV